MSANPAAFAWLRQRAYEFAGRHGRDRDALRQFCFEQIRDWRRDDPEGGELSERAGDDLAYDVADWVAEKYRPKKKQPKSTQKDRALDQATITYWTEEIEEAGERPSVRNVGAWAQYSKTKAGRLLNAEGIAPVREAIVAKLSAKAQRLYRILDWNVRRPGQVALSVSHMIDLVWPPHPVIATKKSARSMQKKRLEKLVSEINAVRLGFHIGVFNGVMAVRSERRWKRLQDIPLYVEEQKMRGRISIPFPLRQVVRPDAFWDQPEIRTCVGLLRFSVCGGLDQLEDVMPVVHVCKPILDEKHSIRAVRRALAAVCYNTFEVLSELADYVAKQNRTVGNGIAKFTGIAQWLLWGGGYGWDARGVLYEVFRRSEYLSFVESRDRAAGDRIHYLLETVIQDFAPCAETLARCERLAREEAANLWRQGPGNEAALQRALEDVPF